MDPQKRSSYDRHGVCPPPSEDARHNSHNSTRRHRFHLNTFTFTDPFELFGSFFGHASLFSFGHSRPFHNSFFSPTPFPLPTAVAIAPFDSRFRIGSGLLQGPFIQGSFMPPMVGGGCFHPRVLGVGDDLLRFFPPPPHAQPTGKQVAVSGYRGLIPPRAWTVARTTRVHESVGFLVCTFHPYMFDR